MSRFWLLLLLIGLTACTALPEAPPRPESHALADTHDTVLARSVAPLLQAHPGQDGFILLDDGLEAFVARAALAEYAARSIDVQYYLYHNDEVGSLFTALLLQAADRGVRVRILVDDIDMGGRDDAIIALDDHPNIEIRLFNPFNRHTPRWLQYLFGLGSVTRRMHNKAYIVDNAFAVLGGRNIGDEYYDARPDLAFADLDVLTIGPVVRDVSAAFDRYWNSRRSWPVRAVIDARPDAETVAALRRQLEARIESAATSEYIQALEHSPLAEQIRLNRVQYVWGDARVVVDDPEKIAASRSASELHLATQIDPLFAHLQHELLIVSPYFVPGEEGVAFFRKLTEKGIRVRILTNSLASNDVPVVHAGYVRYRMALLRAGVELYELDQTRTPSSRQKTKSLTGSSRASLHAKTFLLDRRTAFIGSLNLDPRSFYENTEIGVVIDSTELGETMARGFDEVVRTHAFRLERRIDADGDEVLRWHGVENGKPVVYEREPHTGFWQRFAIGVLMMLPIESQL